MIPIRPVPKPYAWGSYDRLQSLVPSMRDMRGPLAELWYGGHPQSPSMVVLGDDEMTLDAAIRRDPEHMLGTVVSRRWGPALPYLLKMIAVRTPLSLQVHPLDFEARAGFHRENAAGVPLDADVRSFRDDRGKSEMVVALDDFRASIGFAPVTLQLAAFRLIDHDLARLMVRLLEGDAVAMSSAADDCMPPAAASWGHSERNIFRAFWLAVTAGQGVRGCGAWKSTDWLPLLIAARDRASRMGAAGSGETSFMIDGVRSALGNAVDAARTFPGDSAVLALVMMNAVHLAPGAGAFIPTGVPHAYIRGTAVEIMTNSDNVLRAGLTVKHRDVPNLLRNLRPSPEPVRRPESFAVADGVLYRPGLDEFSLKYGVVNALDPYAAAVGVSDGHPWYETSAIVPPPECVDRPRVLVCLSGELRSRVGHVTDTGAGVNRGGLRTVTMRQGDAVFIPASDGPVSIDGGNETTGGTYLLASTGL
ncbi:hypothetical protein EP30_06070 [Bifidobacterium sp. UTCIF-39]|uniref:type I phosphomannose isomerase catalytic subunit n=1 Tax=Bifidobacterium sp. UTCIF-39 TaxID=1465359 RepID=UPI0015E30403|nr:type I phosphomannose isomerase catalytic subunit [Bifidobacterium sp. UTCIF-39]TPF96737.1 hypothetical protein EP30_06070 [Bifidobacterium sp. UTCIF-39]